MKSKPKKNYNVMSRASMIQKLENNTKSSCFSSTSQEGTNDTFTIPKNEISRTKGRNMSQDNSINMLSCYNDKENLFTFSNDDIPDENMEWDYSELMSRLSIWDKNYVKNNNRKSATHNCNQDIFKSEIGKHINQLAGFEKIGSLSSFRSNVFNNQLKPLKINDNTQSNINSNRINYNNQIIKPKYKNNFNFDVFKKKQSLIAPKEEKEIERKNDNKEMLTMTSMPNVNTQTNNNIDMNFKRQIGMGDNTEIQPENDHRLMQEREKEKIENYNREELIKSYKMLSILHIKKGKYKEIIDDTYKLLNEIKKDYLAHAEALKNQKNQMFQKYSSLTKYRSNSQLNYILNSDSNTDKVGIEEMYLKELKKKKKNFEARDDKLKNYQLYYEVIKRIEEKERKCDQEYMMINNELLNIIMQNTEEIYKINNRYREYNKRYEALKKDQTLYYSNLLKQGVDTKNEGLSWILRRLLELNIDLNTLQFPRFLNKKQVDYLINVSKLSYQIHQLNIVLKELKLRQNRISNEDKKKLLETIDCYETKRENINSNNNNKDNNPNREMIKSSSAKLVEFKNKSFFNLLEQKQTMYRNHLNYKEEENKIKRITQSIKNSLKQYTSTGDQIYSSNEDSSQIDFIYNSNKSKEYIDNINILRKRLNEISNSMNNIVKEQQTIFKVKYSSYSNNPMLENAIAYYEQIKKALFGSKQVLYIN